MKYFYILFLSLFIITGCGKSQTELEKEKIQKEADEIKKKIDTTQQKINQEKKSIDSLRKNVERHTPDKNGGDAVTQPDATAEPEKIIQTK